MRVDRLQAELPARKPADAKAAAGLQTWMGAKHGEISPLNDCLFQSLHFRSKAKSKPFYNRIASISVKESGQVELVANGIAKLADGPEKPSKETGKAAVSGAPWGETRRTFALLRPSCRMAAAPCP